MWPARTYLDDAPRWIQRRAITRTGNDDVGPVWSPDGSFIAFARSDELMLVRADGSGERTLGIRGSLPSWTAATSTRRVGDS